MFTHDKNNENLLKIAVLTSGGDAPAMNSAIKAVVDAGEKLNFTVYGVQDGYFGLYHNQISVLSRDNLPRIINAAGTYLGTARFLDFQNYVNIRQQCVKNLNNIGINKLVVIGGDGSYHGATKLEEFGLQCVGIPATIDNDINATDFTIGFSTGVHNIVDAIEKLRDTSLSHRRCSIIEVMGRYKGDLALYGGIAAGADLIVTRQNLIDKKVILEKVKTLYTASKRHAIVVVTEKIFDVSVLAKEVEAYSGFETRAQVLGHLQRGGTPTPEDRVLATRMGAYAVELLAQNIHDCAVSLQGQKIAHVSFQNALNSIATRNPLFDLINKLS